MHGFAWCLENSWLEMGKCVVKKSWTRVENTIEYVILSNNYFIFGNKHLYRNVEWEGKERGAKKKLVVTLISMNNEMHLFIVDNQYHLQIIEIHAKL